MRASRTPIKPRKAPSQARSRQTVEILLEGAARVFRREGFGATTNRIAEEAGVSIGTLYEYFPNKQSLLDAIAERHVEIAEREIAAALEAEGSTAELLARLQAAILASQRFPSQALALAATERDELGARAEALRRSIASALEARARAAGLDEPRLRALSALGAIGDLSARAMYEHPAEHLALARHHLAMALERLGG
ncbi:MAG: TetR/AcrR family transcriptional regulator [Sandaracinaceae bacterium]|nr:TetR/AcrR family transcriptional regulator [Sandaracinaceae bacterium]